MSQHQAQQVAMKPTVDPYRSPDAESARQAAEKALQAERDVRAKLQQKLDSLQAKVRRPWKIALGIVLAVMMYLCGVGATYHIVLRLFVPPCNGASTAAGFGAAVWPLALPPALVAHAVSGDAWDQCYPLKPVKKTRCEKTKD